MVFVSCQFYLALFTVNSGSFFVFRLSCLFLNFSENLGIFRVALLFICQRSVILRCCCSQRQLRYLIMTAFVCQQLFWNLFSSWKTLFSVTGIYVNISVRLCQQLFLKSFQVSFELLRCLGAASTTNLSISSPTVLVNTIFRIFCTNYPLLRQFRINRGFLPCFYSVFYYFTKNGSFCPSCSTRYAR